MGIRSAADLYIRVLVSRSLTPSELILPSGFSRRTAVVGGACPSRLRPATVEQQGIVDFAILAPTEQELLDKEWLQTTAGTLMSRLDTDGVLYVLVPPGARWRTRKVLKAVGAEVIRTVVHHPDWSRSQIVLALDPAPAQYAVHRLMGLRPMKAALAALVLQLPWTLQVVRDRHPGVALAAQRRGARRLGDWLAQLQGGRQPDGVLVTSKWRGEHGTAVVFSFDDQNTPRGIVKLALDRARGKERADREYAMLLQLAPAAQASGAEVPEARVVEAGPGAILLEKPIEGRSAVALLRWRQQSVPAVVARITDWLVRWNRNTVRTRTVDRGWLEEQVLQPSAALPSLRDRPAYLAWLQDQCHRLAGQSVPVVAAHNDLTMSNLLVTADWRLGVLDWEAAGERLPLGDLLYAVVDAAAAEDHYVDRVDAFRHCFEIGGRWYQLVGDAEAKIRGATGAGPEIAAFSFHACWLQHAAAEAAKRLPAEPRPFLRMVERIADRALRIT
jgi:hypothetical protein